ncbi:hypothetical protein [Bifidobacterium sp. SO1]|uniref:hypothetical protein n=1 Tax=Bifidobacterium sp. SO1 TaxID=2809029 RepID=UPI001BDCD958|nr:hypothetical protein [Bifidobacterium sp. SO1]MBT1161752.1 hypothetical protein [Bifidobacterium sp. SO1]
MRDANNRSHRPAGRPDGGQYDHEHDNRTDTDLTPPDTGGHPDHETMLAILHASLEPWEQDDLNRHTDDDTWLRDRYDQLILHDDPDPEQALPILRRLADRQTITSDTPTVRLGDQHIPRTVISQAYKDDPDSLDRLLIRLNADDNTIRQLERHADDPKWIHTHAKPYRPHTDDTTTNTRQDDDPWSANPTLPFHPTPAHGKVRETDPRIDTKPIWDQPIDTQRILDTATPLIHIGHTFTLTRLERSGDRLHVGLNDTDERNRHRTATITDPRLAHMIDDGMRLDLGEDRQWHITRTGRRNSEPKQKEQPTSPMGRTLDQPTPMRQASTAGLTGRTLRKGTLLKGLLDLTVGLYKGTGVIIRDATRRIL